MYGIICFIFIMVTYYPHAPDKFWVFVAVSIIMELCYQIALANHTIDELKQKRRNHHVNN